MDKNRQLILGLTVCAGVIVATLLVIGLVTA